MNFQPTRSLWAGLAAAAAPLVLNAFTDWSTALADAMPTVFGFLAEDTSLAALSAIIGFLVSSLVKDTPNQIAESAVNNQPGEVKTLIRAKE